MSEDIKEIKSEANTKPTRLLCGFKVMGDFYAVPVLEVQEVIKPQSLTPVPLSPNYIKGLINLRGQIVTSVSLRNLFNLEEAENDIHMNIIVRSGESLYALMVDEILDIIDVNDDSYERIPETIDENIKKYIQGVYKLKENLLISLDLNKVLAVDITKGETNE